MIVTEQVHSLFEGYQGPPDLSNLQYEFEAMKHPWRTLDECIKMEQVFMSNNGHIDIGLPYGIFLDYLKERSKPTEFKHTDSSGTKNRIWHTGLTEDTYITDEYTREDMVYYEILEKLFGLKPSTFGCTLVEPTSGMKLDQNSQMIDFLKKAVKEDIPLFVRTATFTEWDYDNVFFIINGIDL